MRNNKDTTVSDGGRNGFFMRLFFVLSVIILILVIILSIIMNIDKKKTIEEEEVTAMISENLIENSQLTVTEEDTLSDEFTYNYSEYEDNSGAEVGTAENNMVKSLDFDGVDADLLLRIGMCEAGNQSVECIANVMLTVLNRVYSDKFPNTISEVLYQKNQFTPVRTGWFEKVVPSEKCSQALSLVMSGWNESQNALFFESCNGDSWHSKNLKFLFQDGDMRFYTLKD